MIFCQAICCESWVSNACREVAMIAFFLSLWQAAVVIFSFVTVIADFAFFQSVSCPGRPDGRPQCRRIR